MTSSLEKELENLEIAIFQGKYTEAMERIEEILKTEDITLENKVRALNLRSLIEFFLGIFIFEPLRFKTANDFALEAYEISKEIDTPSLRFRTIVHLLWTKYRLGVDTRDDDLRTQLEDIFERASSEDPDEAKKIEPLYLIIKSLQNVISAWRGESVPEDHIEKSVKMTERALVLSEEINDLWVRRGSINNLTVFTYRMGKREDQYKYMIKHLEFWEELGNKYGIAQIYSQLALYHISIGESEQYLDYTTKKLRLWEELGVEIGIAEHNSEMGVYYESRRNYDKALEYLKKSLDYFSEKEDPFRVAGISQFIGYIYRMKGDLLQALQYTEDVYEFCSTRKFEGWWNILPNLAAIYLLLGDLDKALHFEEENLNLHKATEFKLDMAQSLSRISMIYWQKGFEDKAISDAQKSLKLFEETGNFLWIGNVLSDLIFFTSEKSDIELAKNYLQKLEEVLPEAKDNVLNLKLNFSEAMILQNSTSSRERLKAELLFENLLREELPYSFRIRILVSVCELILQEINSSNEVESFENLKKYVEELSLLASTNNSLFLSCQTLILQSKLALVELETEQAKALLDDAIEIANNLDLDRLKKIIWKEQDNIDSDKDTIISLDSSAKITEKLELLKVGNGIKRIKKTTTTESIIDDSHIPLKSHI
ncbi:MAG: tetratricopeptide repeat protein [Candidatus Heimdallarchaeaceae archaeon]